MSSPGLILMRCGSSCKLYCPPPAGTRGAPVNCRHRHRDSFRKLRDKTGIFAVLISDSVVFTTEFAEDFEDRTAVRGFRRSGSQFRWKNNVNQNRCRRKYRFARHRPPRVSHYVLCECLAYRNSVVFTTEFAKDFTNCTAGRVFLPQ